jgi:hypothetical protein
MGVDQNLIPMETRLEMMPTLTSRIKEMEPFDNSWIVRSPRSPATSARITTAANVSNATAQDAQAVDVRVALGPQSINK